MAEANLSMQLKQRKRQLTETLHRLLQAEADSFLQDTGLAITSIEAEFLQHWTVGATGQQCDRAMLQNLKISIDLGME